MSAGTLLQATPELYRITAFGLLFAFYSLESAHPFWCFMWFYMISWPFQFVGVSGAQPIWVNPTLYATQDFWHSWGYFFVDAYAIPVGLVAAYYIIKWRRSVLAKEGERHPRFWGFWEGIGLPYVLLWRGLKKALENRSKFEALPNWRMFIFGNVTIMSTISTDGLTFAREQELPISGASTNTIAVENGYRIYLGAGPKIFCSFSVDGKTWENAVQVLECGPPGSLDRRGVADPAIVRMPNNTYKMFYKTWIEKFYPYLSKL